MTKEEALNKSIEKWEAIVAGTGVDKGVSNCSLCTKYNTEDSYCTGCPVREKTGKGGCFGTPYTKWDRHQDNDHYSFLGTNYISDGCEVCKQLAEKELEFLKSLRMREV